MTRRLLCFAFLVLLAAGGCRERKPPELQFVEFPPHGENGPPAEQPPHESLVAILARPEDFHGKRLVVQGVINLQLEGNQLCLDRGSLQYLAVKNCMWVRFAEGPLAGYYDEIAKWNGRYALLEGEVSATDRGHFGLFRGAIVNVTRVTFIKPPGRPLPPEE